ncbi:hypothetical protein ABEO79_00100 [Micromonospora provocatoris]
MTPYELSLYINDYNERQKVEQEDKLTLAYLTAAWQRAKKMPSIEKVINRQEEIGNKEQHPKEQTLKQMFNNVKMLNAMFGGTIKQKGGN